MKWRIDLSQQVAISTNGVDAHAQLPADVGAGKVPSPYWLIAVAGSPCYLNVGAAATNANAQLPVGTLAQPLAIPSGTVVHALSSGGPATVSLIRCYPA